MVLVALVILGHAFITYGDIGSWVYREQSDNEAYLIVAAVVVSLGSLFAMGLFFLVAGLLTPGPLRRKGPAGFLRDRAVRLGVPFLAYLLLVYPLASWAGKPDRPASAYLRDAWLELDPGPLWFVGVLLLFTVCYVAWRAVRPAPAGPYPPLRAAHLVGLAVAIAVGTALVRTGFEMDSGQPLSAHVWQWPQCIGLFVLGLVSAERGWLVPVAPGLRRGAGWSALAGAVLLVAAIGTAESSDAFIGGVTWQALLTAALEGIISVGLSVWLLGTFQRRFDHAGPLATGLGRAAFGAYVLQAPVLLGCALLARPLPVPPEVKFLLVAPVGIAGSFALAWLLTRLPVVRRVL